MNRIALSLCVCLMVSLGCRSGESSSGGKAAPQSGNPLPESSPESPVSLTNRIWIRAGKSDLPGVMRVFLSGGTLIMDSCWETYRLAKWRMEPGQTLVWNEDGVDIRAKVVVLNEGELVLSVELKSGAEEQRYQTALAPYVCPDIPR